MSWMRVNYQVLTKEIRELEEKLLGFNKGALPDYLQILYETIKHVVPCFERTRVLEIAQMDDGEMVLVTMPASKYFRC